VSIGQLSNVGSEIGDGHPDLLHGVKVSQCDGLVLERVEVDSDCEGDTALVCACIALTDGLSGVVDLGRDTSTRQGLLYRNKSRLKYGQLIS
jgi:hypothetical protein